MAQRFVLKKSVFILLLYICYCESASSPFQCSPNVFQCNLGAWTAWSPCSASCGGGITYIFKSLCCPKSFSTLEKCADACNITKAEYYQSKTCNETCVNGVYRGNKCQCPSGHYGKCCENVGTSPTFIRTTISGGASPAPAGTAKSAGTSPEPAGTAKSDLLMKAGDTNENCFADKKVTTTMVILILLAVGGVVVDVLLGYWVFKLKKKLGGVAGSTSKMLGTGTAPVSTKIIK